MLQNAKVIGFTVSGLLRENHQEVGGDISSISFPFYGEKNIHKSFPWMSQAKISSNVASSHQEMFLRKAAI